MNPKKIPVQNLIQMTLKWLSFFEKLQKIAQRIGALPPDPLPPVIRVSYTSLLTTMPNEDISRKKVFFGFKSPLNKILNASLKMALFKYF